MRTYITNYERLKNLKQRKYYLIIILVSITTISFLISSLFISVSKKITTYGIYEDEVLKININNELSDKIRKNNTLIFNGTKVSYQSVYVNNYEVIDNNIYLNLWLTVDKKFYDNEVGEVTLCYDKEKLIKYIFELFK